MDNGRLIVRAMTPPGDSICGVAPRQRLPEFAKTARTLYALRLLDGAVVWTFTPHRAKGEHDRAGSMPTAEGAMVSSAGRKVWPSARHPPKGEVPDAVWLRAPGRGRPA